MTSSCSFASQSEVHKSGDLQPLEAGCDGTNPYVYKRNCFSYCDILRDTCPMSVFSSTNYYALSNILQ